MLFSVGGVRLVCLFDHLLLAGAVVLELHIGIQLYGSLSKLSSGTFI